MFYSSPDDAIPVSLMVDPASWGFTFLFPNKLAVYWEILFFKFIEAAFKGSDKLLYLVVSIKAGKLFFWKLELLVVASLLSIFKIFPSS